MNKLTENDRSFLWVSLKLGLGALLYRGALELFSYVISPVILIITVAAPENTVLYNSMTYLLTGMVSVAAFLVAAVTLWIILRVGKRRNYQPTFWRWRITVYAPFLIIAAIALNFAMAEINALLMSLLAPNVSIDMLAGGGAELSVIEIILMLVSTAVIPGIVEEIMFRGIILTNLAPYGRGMAIVCSALLFGLMHMNPSQFFYTTILGLVLGYLYVRTRSIWICIIIHFTNNALGVLQQIIYMTQSTEMANAYLSVMMIAVALLGIISMGILLIVRAVKRRDSAEENGSFGCVYEPELSYATHPVARSKKMLLFFSPTTSLFTVIVFSSMITMMLTMLAAGFILGMVPGVLGA